MNRHIVNGVRWIPAAAITACSWHLSSQPTIAHMPQFWNADKLVHTLCFGGLAFWTAFGVRFRPQWKPRLSILLPAACVSLYGIVDEIHQSFTPGRSCSPFDWMADTLGALLGSAVFYVLVRNISQRRSSRLSPAPAD